ncbi:MAG TPA: cellulase family glycosylhydrolase [Acidimicrobiia bacterium]|nr:cellulase family glycosylhydrolase [Acidimicrobiia bacterium]
MTGRVTALAAGLLLSAALVSPALATPDPVHGRAQVVAPCATPSPPTPPPRPGPRPAALARLAPLRLPAPPLRTRGPDLVDRRGAVVRLASVNWYGAEEQDSVVGGLDRQPLDTIAAEIRALGFNSVRLPWSNALLHDDPTVCDASVAANPSLRGKRALAVLDAVITALGRQGLMVILDNHMTTADWCCLPTDEDSLWYNAGHNAADPAWVQSFHTGQWLADWQTMARRYRGPSYHNVIGADLRNEPRGGATWGSPAGPAPGCRPPAQDTKDWRDAAERGAACVLAASPDLLIMVEGVGYSLDFTGIPAGPVVLPRGHEHQLVYSPHDYQEDHAPDANADAGRLAAVLDQRWGSLATGPGATPVWVGEFGTCHTPAVQCDDNRTHSREWFANLAAYVTAHRFGWSYWPLNGTQSRGSTRQLGAEETFGVLDPTWACSAQPGLTAILQRMVGAAPAVSLRCRS